MSEEIICECGHSIERHSFHVDYESDEYKHGICAGDDGCYVDGCNCGLNPDVIEARHQLQQMTAERNKLQESLKVTVIEHDALERNLEVARNLLERLNEWDMLNGYLDINGERVPATADGPYWKREIDNALAEMNKE